MFSNNFGAAGVCVPVKAFMNVDSDLLSILKKGSLQGYFSDPHSTVCSRMCGTPVLSRGVVLNWTLRKQRGSGQRWELAEQRLKQTLACTKPEEVVGVISGRMEVLSSRFIVGQLHRRQEQIGHRYHLDKQEFERKMIQWSSPCY